MPPNDSAEINKQIWLAIRKARGYADFFGWPQNRDLEELGVVGALAESLEPSGNAYFSSIAARGRGNDPPDAEGVDQSGNRIAFEVTELVDGEAIQAYKAGRRYDFASWSRPKFLSTLTSLLKAKNERFSKLKGGPYPGGYVVLVFSDEPALPHQTVSELLANHSFPGLDNVTQAYLLLSYSPALACCPYFRLERDG